MPLHVPEPIAACLAAEEAKDAGELASASRKMPWFMTKGKTIMDAMVSDSGRRAWTRNTGMFSNLLALP